MERSGESREVEKSGEKGVEKMVMGKGGGSKESEERCIKRC